MAQLVRNGFGLGDNSLPAAKRVMQYEKYYEQLKPVYEQIKNANKEIFLSYYKEFKKFYPQAHYPYIMMSIDALMAGGTVVKEGLVTGLEFYGKNISDKEKILGKHFSSFLMNEKEAYPILFHEQMHFEQRCNIGFSIQLVTLLDRTLTEGAADFISNLFTKHVDKQPYTIYGLKHEKEIWKAFKKDLYRKFDNKEDRQKISKWSRKQEKRDLPDDLLYFVGARICKAYYDKAKDKKQAIYDILYITPKTSKEFLEQSGYDALMSK